MDPDRLLHLVVVVSGLLAIVLGVELRGREADRAWTMRATQAIDAFTIADQSLRREVLSTRVGLSRHYDEMNRAMTKGEAALRELADLSGQAPALAHETEALASRVRARHAAVERFKTDNALLQNALARFGSLSDAPDGADAAGRLSPFILRLTLDTSAGAVRAARDEFARLYPAESSQSAGAPRAVAAQARQLIALLPEVDEILRSLRDDGLESEARRIREAIAGHDRANQAWHATLSWLLAGTLLACLAAGGVLAMRAVERNRRLRRQSANEHLGATVAGLLLAPDGQDADARIGKALERLAAHAGTPRVVLALGDRPPLRVLGWPAVADEEAQRLASLIEGSRAMPGWEWDLLAVTPTGSGDGRGMLLLRDGRSAQAVLALDADATLPVRRPELVAGLRMAMAALVQAVRREAADAERIELERRLGEAQRLEAIGTIASGVAHNFNNIVGAIGGFSEMARERVRKGSAVARHLDEIEQAVARARTLIEDILGFAGRRRVAAHRFRLDTLLNETAGLLRAGYPEEVAVIVRADVTDEVLGSGARLQQVFMNLCNNARAAAQDLATTDSATITLTASRRSLDRPARLSHGSVPAGDYVVVAVDDDGPGVPRAILPRLFEPFFTTRPCGTGLGLSTAWQIVHDHGGSINVVLPPRGGSSFEVWLPRAHAEGRGETRWLGSGERVLLMTAEERAADDETLLAALGCEPIYLSYEDVPENLDTALAQVDAVLAIAPPPDVAGRLQKGWGRLPLIVAADSGEDRTDTPDIFLRLPLQEESLAAALGALLAPRAPRAFEAHGADAHSGRPQDGLSQTAS